MSADAVHPINRTPELEDAVEILIERHGLDAAENRLLAALSAVRYRQYQEARR